MLKQTIKKLKQTLAKTGLKLIHKPKKSGLTKIKGKKFYLHPKVFNSKWTFSSIFLAENLEVNNGDVVLDLGCGNGFQTVFVAQKASYVLALDLNPAAVKCTKINVKFNGLKNKVDVLAGNLFQPLKNEKFNLIVFNPPYLPGNPKNILEKAWLDKGGLLIKKFFDEAKKYLKPKGKIQIVYSDIAVLNPNEIEKLIGDNNFKIIRKVKRKFMFETLTVYLAKLEV